MPAPLLTRIGNRIRQMAQRRFVQLLLGLPVLGWGLDKAFPITPTIWYATEVRAQNGTLLHTFLSRDDKWRFYTAASDINPALKDVIIFKEDRYFYYHPGINPLAMLRAAVRNAATGRRTSGASTLTMQTVRLLEPRPRTYASKLIEVIRAVQLECHFSKDEILRLYLTLVPYGGNIEGIRAAALLYFGKTPELLSFAELTTLAIVPNRPSSLRPGKANAQLIRQRNRWLRRLAQAGICSQATLADALAEPLTVRRLAPPQLAPHLARRVAAYASSAETPIIQTTIQPNLQATAEALTRQYVSRIRAVGIQNAAVLVVDNESREVVAYVGSADFANRDDGGQVDGIRAVRSPGSALKPLLYGLAFDAGLITPKTRLADVPTAFDGYAPTNFDERFNGLVTASFALANSLNMPAVQLLNELGTPAFINSLRQAGFYTIGRQARTLGLSMILGGCGVTLEEMTRLYVSFANHGQYGPLQYTTGSSAQTPTTKPPAFRPPTLSPEATFLITQTLTQITRPDLPNNFDNSYHLPRIAWKTGTSYGRRDAWSIGYNARYTVGVWVGNFSGVGVAGLSGANTATPLLFQVFNALDYDSPTGGFTIPNANNRLITRTVCPETGDVPSDCCRVHVTDYAIMGVSRVRPCGHVQVVPTNRASTFSYCVQCRPDSGLVYRSYANLPPDVLAFYRQQQLPVAVPPPHNPACERVSEQAGPQITSLTHRSEYFIDRHQPTELSLACQAANDVANVYWYLNRRLYRKAKPGETVFFRPKPGLLRIDCADDRGRHNQLTVMIRYP